jgi:hypothetical protein
MLLCTEHKIAVLLRRQYLTSIHYGFESLDQVRRLAVPTVELHTEVFTAPGHWPLSVIITLNMSHHWLMLVSGATSAAALYDQLLTLFVSQVVLGRPLCQHLTPPLLV